MVDQEKDFLLLFRCSVAEGSVAGEILDVYVIDINKESGR